MRQEQGRAPLPDAAHQPTNDVEKGKESSVEESLVVAFPRSAQERPLHNLPLQLSSLVGREREISEVKRLLLEEDKNRLLTLTGPGGCGKTRLGLAVAFEVVEDFEEDGGVWLVELGSLSDPDLVPQAVASTLGVREQPGHPLTATLVDALRSRRLLLVLDNCEHLIEACATLTEALLRAGPKVCILATSREALGVGGERVRVVPSLSLPDPERLTPIEELRRYEAVKLFLERAKAVVSAFELTGENATAVARLCRGLDGVPLASKLGRMSASRPPRQAPLPYRRTVADSCRMPSSRVRRNFAFRRAERSNLRISAASLVGGAPLVAWEERDKLLRRPNLKYGPPSSDAPYRPVSLSLIASTTPFSRTSSAVCSSIRPFFRALSIALSTRPFSSCSSST